MSAGYPLQSLLLAQSRRVERALAEIVAANQRIHQRQADLLQAQRLLDAARQARRLLQQTLSQNIAGRVSEGGGGTLSAGELIAPAQRLGWLQDRVEECGKARAAASAALDEAQTVAAQARAIYRRVQAKYDGLMTHQERWRQQRTTQRLRSEEAGMDDLLAHRNLSTG